MEPSYRVAAVLIGSVFLGALSAFGGLYAFGVAVGTLPTPPHWITTVPNVYVPALRFLVWLPVVALCAFLITRVARSKVVALGVVAGLSGLFVLLVQLRSSAYSNGLSITALIATYWVEVALLLAGVPILCALPQYLSLAEGH